MEDGVFLGRTISEVLCGVISLPEAIEIYEQTRIPRAWTKAQASYIGGTINMAMGDLALKRNEASALEVEACARNIIRVGEGLPATYRSWQMFCNPSSVPGILNYDAEGEALRALA